MATLLDSLGYNTYILKTIKSVTECKKIIVYNKKSFRGDYNYSRINLYNLTDIFYRSLYNKISGNYDPRCLPIVRDLSDPLLFREIPFEYNCENTTTNGFDVIIYIADDGSPAGYTEFLNVQGRISQTIKIYLNFNIESYNIELKLNNYLYKIKDLLPNNFIGNELNKFAKSSDIKDKIDRLPKNQWYTNHLTSFLSSNNKSNIALGDRALLYTGDLFKINFSKNSNIFIGEEYSYYQIGYYGSDVVLYSWIYLQDGSELYYKITSLLTQMVYKYTHQVGDTIVDTVGKYDPKETKQELIYCAGKYLVFNITYTTYSKVVLFDTTNDSWVNTKGPNPIVDPLDRKMIINELPKSSTIQSYSTALELFPSLSDIYFNLHEYINITKKLEILKKYGDWFFIRYKNELENKNFYIATCSSQTIYMTFEEYQNCIIINNNTILIKTSDTYYTMYYGNKRKEYWTEKARCLNNNSILHDISLRNGIIYMSSDVEESKYLEFYNKSEVAIIYLNDLLYNTLLDSFRHQPLYAPYRVPSRIIGALGGLIFYINQDNNLNYL